MQALILTPDPGSEVPQEAARVFGLTSLERLERALARAGVERIEVLPAHVDSRPNDDAPRLVLRGDYFYDERLVQGLVDGPERILCDGDRAVAARVDAQRPLAPVLAALRGHQGGGDIGAPEVVPTDVAPAYNAALRKHDPPFLFLARPDRVRETEDRIFGSAYKGITDLVTKWVFPLPSRWVTRQLALRGVRPNQVTAVSYGLTLLAAWLFLEGHLALGLAAAWAMTFLDTVDGKLARVTLTSTPLGNVLDHGLDLVHPPFWWAAFALGLTPAGEGLGPYALSMWIIIGGYVVGRLLEGVFLLAFSQEIFTWRPFDAAFRTVISRRNPNLLLLTASVALGHPGLGYHAVAIWTLVCIAVHGVRIGQAFALTQNGVAIRPWYQDEGADPGATVSR